MLRLARYRSGSQDAVQDGLGVDAFHFGFGTQPETVAECGQDQGLDIVWGDVVASGQPCPSPGSRQQGRRATGRHSQLHLR